MPDANDHQTPPLVGHAGIGVENTCIVKTSPRENIYDKAAHEWVAKRIDQLGDVCGPMAPPLQQEQVLQSPALDLKVKTPELSGEEARARLLPDKGVNPKDTIGATKAPLGLLPWTGLAQVAEVMGLGAKKYGAHNWREPGKAVQHMTYCEAALRHMAAYIDGQTIDPESGQSHLAHVAACALILLDASAIGNSVDNRPTPGVAAEIMALHGKPA